MPPPVVYKGTFPASHSDMAGDNLHQPFHYAQAGDPGSVGAGLWWFDTSTNILKRRNSTNTGWDSVTIGSVPAHTHAQTDVTNLVTDLSNKQPLDADLTALAALSTTGIVARTAANTYVPRTITGTANQVGVTNGDGVSGVPTIALDAAITKFIGYTVTYGPYFLNDVPGTATTQADLMMFNTTTAVSLTTNEIRAGRVCTVVGMAMVADAARATGSAKARLRLSGVDTAFNSDACLLDATLTTQVTSIVTDPASGVAIASGGTRLGVNIVTSGWTPITANVAVWIIVLYTF